MTRVWFVTSVVVSVFAVSFCAPLPEAWCYHTPSCSGVMWPMIAKEHCNGSQQSPIDITTNRVQTDPDLASFTFTGYDDRSTLTEIKNTGMSIKVMLDHTKMHVEGGNLSGLFSSQQFHLHWGNGSRTPGSEHAVDGKRYPMELHIVNTFEHDGSTSVAVLGFFIEATDDIGKPESWKTLTSYLPKITDAGDEACIMEYISMDDLLPGVDRTKYYRYTGSLTTPPCTEGVVWTIFKDPVRVSQDLIDLFSTSVYVKKATVSPLMVNTFRGLQPLNGRIVTSSVAGSDLSSFFDVLDLAPDFPTAEPSYQFEFHTDTYW